jgi:hypothetical protein
VRSRLARLGSPGGGSPSSHACVSVFLEDNLALVYQGSTRLSSRGHRESPPVQRIPRNHAPEVTGGDTSRRVPITRNEAVTGSSPGVGSCLFAWLFPCWQHRCAARGYETGTSSDRFTGDEVVPRRWPLGQFAGTLRIRPLSERLGVARAAREWPAVPDMGRRRDHREVAEARHPQCRCGGVGPPASGEVCSMPGALRRRDSPPVDLSLPGGHEVSGGPNDGEAGQEKPTLVGRRTQS